MAKQTESVPVRPTEKVYNGRTLKEWSAILNQSREDAVYALPHFGAEGVRIILNESLGEQSLGLDLNGLNPAELTAVAPALID